VEFLNYFGAVFEPVAFGLLLIGTIGGLILGATPGLSPTMAVALLIPFTFHLAPVQGLILLGAAYTSTVAGGAVSAILLKIPGAPANWRMKCSPKGRWPCSASACAAAWTRR